MTDMSLTIAPKSDQLNADDLISGPKTITITKVSADPGSQEQPIAINFEGDQKKPYKPCKSMRRIMVAVWGSDGNEYVGRSMTLFRDPNVKFGGMEVGGIRISHMSHMEREMTMAMTITKARRAPYTVKPLKAIPKPEHDADTGEIVETAAEPPALDPTRPKPIGGKVDQAWCGKFVAAINGAPDSETLESWVSVNAAKLEECEKVNLSWRNRIEERIGEARERVAA